MGQVCFHRWRVWGCLLSMRQPQQWGPQVSDPGLSGLVPGHQHRGPGQRRLVKPSGKASLPLTGSGGPAWRLNDALVSPLRPGAVCGRVVTAAGITTQTPAICHSPCSTPQSALCSSHVGNRAHAGAPKPRAPAACCCLALSHAPCLPVCSGPARPCLGLSPAPRGPLPALPGLGRAVLCLSLSSA